MLPPNAVWQLNAGTLVNTSDQSDGHQATMGHLAAAFTKARAVDVRSRWITAAVIIGVFALQFAFTCFVLVLFTNR